jgi:hypothetical protein
MTDIAPGATTWGLSPVRAARGLPPLVYLATPYSKRARDAAGAFDWAAADEAAREANAYCAAFERLGLTAISPIVNAHAIVRRHGVEMGPQAAAALALDAVHWTRWCAPLLAACGAVYVPALRGFDVSDGIAHEVAEALAANKPVVYEAVP